MVRLTGCEIGNYNLIVWWKFSAPGSLTLHVTVSCNRICAGLCLVVVATAVQYCSIEAPDSYTAHVLDNYCSYACRFTCSTCTGCHMPAGLNNVTD